MCNLHASLQQGLVLYSQSRLFLLAMLVLRTSADLSMSSPGFSELTLSSRSLALLKTMVLRSLLVTYAHLSSLPALPSASGVQTHWPRAPAPALCWLICALSTSCTLLQDTQDHPAAASTPSARVLVRQRSRWRTQCCLRWWKPRACRHAASLCAQLTHQLRLCTETNMLHVLLDKTLTCSVATLAKKPQALAASFQTTGSVAEQSPPSSILPASKAYI